MDTASENLWRGTSSDERADERRARLLSACRDVVGREGCAALTVRAVCRAGGVSPRHFYDAFPDADALLLATYEQAVGQLLTAVAVAVAARREGEPMPGRQMLPHVFEAAVSHLEQHPEDGRIIFAEALANDVLRTRAVVSLPAFVQGVRHLVFSPNELAGSRDDALTATLLSGALAAAFVEWLSGTAAFGRAELIARCADFTWRALSGE